MDKERTEAKGLASPIFGLDDQMMLVILLLRDEYLDWTWRLIV